MANAILAENVRRLRVHLGLKQSAFADRIETEQANVSKWEGGKSTPGTAPLAAMAHIADVSPHSFMTSPWAPPGEASDQPIARTIDSGETAAVMRMDLRYALGPGTNVDEDYIEGEAVELDISFLRRLTPSSPSMLRIVSGVGDSMGNTIGDHDDLILDLGQRVMNLQDRIWAMSLFGVGAVKRLKAIGKDRVMVISDNPDVPDQEVDAADLYIVGRIVGSIRRH
ncbi:XRE family transcriptional regulator [Sphingomonas panacisoli]|nr:LexA family transcriptional regulator [Sphingomonas panacisoli]